MSTFATTSAVTLHRARIEEVLRVFAKYGMAELTESGRPDELPGVKVIRDFLGSRVDERIVKMTRGERLGAAFSELGTV